MFVKQTGDAAPDDITDYDADAFYTADAGGDTIRVRVSSDMMRSILTLVTDPDFPDYHTQADVVRDAVVHLLYKRALQSKDPRLMEKVKRYAQRAAMQAMFEEIEADATLARQILQTWKNTAEPSVRKQLIRQLDYLKDRPIPDELRHDIRALWLRYVEMDSIVDFTD